jgi:hypothetical protein
VAGSANNRERQIAYQIFGSGPEDLLLIGGYHISIDSMDEEPSLARFHRRLASFSRVIGDPRGLGLSDASRLRIHRRSSSSPKRPSP